MHGASIDKLKLQAAKLHSDPAKSKTITKKMTQKYTDAYKNRKELRKK